MTDTHFQWHQDARAFAGSNPVTPSAARPCGEIPATPAASALEGLQATLGARPFCVSDIPIAALDTLPDTHFATLTGGTSGPPKVIARSHASWIASFRTNAALFSYTTNDSIAVLGGLSHSLALYGVLEGLHLGLAVHALSDLSPRAQSRALHVQKCSILYATPTQLRLLPAGQPLPDIRLILCGGGALSADTHAHITSLCPHAQLHVFYGAAETSFVTLSDPSTPEGSVGRAYPGAEIDLRDTDSQGIGTLWVRSPYLFDRYLQGDSPHTRCDGDWLTVGERGRMDAQGNLFIMGRAGRVLTVADQTLYPERLEAAYCAATQTPFCAVLARPDPLRGQHLIAVLPGAEDADLRASLLAQCKAQGLHAPRAVVFLDPFPLLPSGKPDLQQIAAQTGAEL